MSKSFFSKHGMKAATIPIVTLTAESGIQSVRLPAQAHQDQSPSPTTRSYEGLQRIDSVRQILGSPFFVDNSVYKVAFESEISRIDAFDQQSAYFLGIGNVSFMPQLIDTLETNSSIPAHSRRSTILFNETLLLWLIRAILPLRISTGIRFFRVASAGQQSQSGNSLQNIPTGESKSIMRMGISKSRLRPRNHFFR